MIPIAIYNVFFHFKFQRIFLENPFLGLGTNKYEILVNEQYYYLPKFMKMGIHGEFQRVLVENGLVGIIAYLFIWYKSWKRTKIFLFEAQKKELINKEQFNLYCIQFILHLLFMLELKLHQQGHFSLVIISLLPDFIDYNFRKTNNSINTK